MISAELIPKEDIPKYKLTRASEDHSMELQDKLRGALRLGNEFKSKAVITFQTLDGPKRVETTVWTLTEDSLQLKNGVVLPLGSLLDISY
ncbi:hypothetical protein GCM10011386_44860 [Parapedobacter defluvii]|uniref:Uncharacterized protein n=1 Tax=Parapedobacter defluvii TaxID=2045106 RepID=A0ABQ1MW14_9SPHI|nr:hypothetical protein [Parapedobacter defluvii]RQP15760.1 MAG: hypothetical protein EAS52_14020 [Parapedobacter sp.]GGC47711.1 hypothetical protein GCM10011386_44860 [Parapedobacter defluvii]